MGKKKKKSSNKVSPDVVHVSGGVSIQHVSKEKLGKTKFKKDITEDNTQNKSSKLNQSVMNEFGSRTEQGVHSLEIDNDKDVNKSTDEYESCCESTTDITVRNLSQEHDVDVFQKKENSISKNKLASNKKDKGSGPCLGNGHKVDEWETSFEHSALPHRTDESKNWRQKEDTNQARKLPKSVHNYQTSNPSTSQNKEIGREKNFHGGSKRDNSWHRTSSSSDRRNERHRSSSSSDRRYERHRSSSSSDRRYERHRSSSSSDRRNESNKKRNSNFNADNHFLSKNDRPYTKDKPKYTQVNKKQNSYSQNDYSQFESTPKVPTKSLQSSHVQTLANFVDDKEFHLWLQKNKDKFICITEVEGNLFDTSEDSCLAHCVAEDMSMGSGIAVTFRKTFKNVAYLLSQRQRAGGLAILEDKNRFIYYLVTKKNSRGKPTLATMWASLNKLKNHMVVNNAKSLAIPRIGCGLDRLEWCEVKPMIEYLFSETGIPVKVYTLPKQSEAEDLNTKQQVIRNCKVVTVDYSLNKIDEYTIIVYFCSEEGEKTKQITTLDKKFNILSLYNNSSKTLGSVIRHEKGNFIVYGFVVKTKPSDYMSFESLQKCIYELNSRNKKDRFEYVAIEEFSDPRDDLIFDKVINLMRNGLKYVEIYICQPHVDD